MEKWERICLSRYLSFETTMSLASGTRLGAYEIVSLLGAGGMGEVYKARDGRLERTVAVKTLPPRVASDPSLRQRFEREAKALATLSHPHICSVFDVGHATTDQGAIDFLVIEYLEGETLAQRLARGALPSSDALRCAVEMADALDKAHRKGVIHRDLKPGNIMLTPQGVKLLDFGLAKLVTEPLDADVTKAANSPLTGAGTIVGTFQYMAPEQLEGQEADARSDIFAFGAVLYEMFTGRKAFEGKSQASLVGAILEREPAPVSSVQPASPPALDQIVKTCRAKNPDNRWQSAGDIGRQLQWIRDGVTPSTASAPVPVVAPPVRRTWLLPAAAFGLVALGAVGVALWALTRPSAPKQVSRLLLAPAPSAPLVSVGGYDVAISPDGTKIVYLGEAQQGGRALYLRPLNGLEPQRISGTELPSDFDNANPFFSWDGQSIGFRSPGKGILRVAMAGGPPVKIADDNTGFIGGAWGPDDNVILAMGGSDTALYRTPAGGGGSLERLTTPVDQPGTGVFYTAPSMLPSGKAVLFYILRLQQQLETITVLDLQTRKLKTLVEGGSNPQYAPSGHLVFARGTTLMAVAFDPNRLEVSGTPGAVLPGVRHPGILTAADFGVSRTGTLIYVPGPEASGTGTAVTPVWVDRQGRQAASVVNTPLINPRNPRLSPDGTRLLLVSGAPGRGELAVFRLDGRPPLPLAQATNILGALWSKDGSRVFFASNTAGTWGTFSIPADGSSLQPQPLPISPPEPAKDGFSSQAPMLPLAWMPNGDLLLGGVRGSGNAPSSDLVTTPPAGGKTNDLIRTEYAEDAASVSPDGRWIAYRSTRSGRPEIWVQGVGSSAPVRVSQNGGREPLWSRDGRELYYLEGNKLMALAVKQGEEFSFGPSTVLFDQPYFHGLGGPNLGLLDALRSYDVAKDGRFVMIPPPGNPNVGGAPPPGIVVVQNWSEELKIAR
jgi:eukaryotic-like serine/threonine-protein kinase